jgi:DNA modification methylase
MKPHEHKHRRQGGTHDEVQCFIIVILLEVKTVPSRQQKRAFKRKLTKVLRRLEVIARPIADLKVNPNNPRLHSPRQIRQIANSIEVFGLVVPILIDGGLTILAVHGRVLAAQLLGWSEVPTILLDHLTEAQAAAFAIADNRLTENSWWDNRLLAQQLKELSILNLDFDLDVTGFEVGQIDFMIEQLDVRPEGEPDPADQLPRTEDATPVSRPGALWLLGNNRVRCGDALRLDSYVALMNRKKASMVISDVPYNVRIVGNVSGLGAIKHRDFIMASGEMSVGQYTEFLTLALSHFARHSVSGSIHYIFIDWRHIGELLAAGKQIYQEVKNMCVWAKDTPGMGSFYRSQTELIFVFKNGRDRHRNNIQLGQFGRNRSNLWTYPAINSFARKNDEGNLLTLAPTVKPAALVADAIMDCTARNDIVLDGFLGSGTTVIAAERTGRRCYGLELDPLYVDTIVRRWQAFTRAEARDAETGRTFNELEQEARAQHAK